MMNRPWKWDEDDLLALISTGTKESMGLHCKACGALEQTDGEEEGGGKDAISL